MRVTQNPEVINAAAHFLARIAESMRKQGLTHYSAALYDIHGMLFTDDE